MLLLDIAAEALRPTLICAAAGVYVVWSVIYALYISPVRNIPGPLLHRISWVPMRIMELLGAEQKVMRCLYEKYGNVFVLEPTRIALGDPGDCAKVLSTHAFRKDYYYDRVEVFEPNTLLTSDPGLNSHRRRQIGPALNLRNLLHMEDIILDAGARQILEKWDCALAAAGPDGQARVCYYDDFVLMAFDVVSSLSFGQAYRSLTTGERHIIDLTRQCIKVTFMEMGAPIMKYRPFKWLAGSLYAQADKLFEFTSKIIKTRKQLLASGAEKPKDILQSFIDAEDPESKVRMTPSEVQTEVIVSAIAGSDTTSLTLSWTLHLLLLHPQCLRRVTDEVRAAFAAGHTIRYEEAKEKLPYLEACLYESMRLRSVAGNIPRIVPPGGMTFQGHLIPGGYSCAVSIAAVSINKDVWERPHAFDPERFIANPDNKRAVLTFSSGVRICPGRFLAWWEMVTAMANIFNAYDLSLPDDALFTPDRLDANGQPVTMSEYHGITRFPKYPARDCVVVISKRPPAGDK